MSDAFTLNFIEALNVNLALGYIDFRLALWLIHWLKLVGSTSLKLGKADRSCRTGNEGKF
jgi:uncharacterized membrane protein